MICASKDNSNPEFQHLNITGQKSLNGKVSISGAKNSALVLLAASLLTKEEICLENVPKLTDIKKMKNILQNLGVVFSNTKSGLKINSKDLYIDELPYELVNSLRASFFCIGPLLTRLGEISLALPGGCDIGERPINEHLRGLKELGATIDIQNKLVNARINNKRKRLIGTNIRLKCPSVGATETLIMAGTLAEGTTTIDNAAREPEIQDLCQMLNKMGANIKGGGDSRIKINGVNKLKGCFHKVIPDRIEAGTFLIAAAATLSSITISPVVPDHLKAVISKLRESGSKILITQNSISISTKCIRPIDIETAPYPGFPTDLQAPIMALLTIAEGNSRITENMFEERLKHISSLNKMGADITVKNNVAYIKGVKELHGDTLLGSDLRSTAAIIIAALHAKNNSTISGLEHLDRGYENLEIKLNKLGATIEREFDKDFNSPSRITISKSSKSSQNFQAA